MDASAATARRTITRLGGDSPASTEDEMLVETRLALVVNGAEVESAVCTAGHEECWAVGHLVCGGVVSGFEDIGGIDVSPGRVSVRVERRGGPRPKVPSRLVRASVLVDGAEWLAGAPVFRATGGTHVAALVSLDGERLFRVEDIGRHNAVDKAVGWAVMNRVPLAEVALLVSGRLPSDMVGKAVAAGVPVMGSVSAATWDGAAAAETGGVVLAGFIRGGRMNVYTYPERVSGNSQRSSASQSLSAVTGFAT